MAETTKQQVTDETPDERFATLVRVLIDASPGDEYFVAFELEDVRLGVVVHVLHDDRIFAEWRRSDSTFLMGREYRIDGVTQDTVARVVGDGIAAHFCRQSLLSL